MPLQDKLVIVTRTESGNRDWATRLQAQDARVYCLPTIETVPLVVTAHTTAILEQLADFDWLVLTSATAARYLLQALPEQVRPSSLKANVQIAAIGTRTAHVLQEAGFNVAFQPTKPNSQALSTELPLRAGKRVLLPRTTIATSELADTLRARGGVVTTIPLYETCMLDTPDEQFAQLLQAGSVDYVTFASPSAVRGFCKRVAEPYLPIARELPAIAIGPTVATALAQHGFHHVYTSSTPSITGIIDILQQLNS